MRIFRHRRTRIADESDPRIRHDTDLGHTFHQFTGIQILGKQDINRRFGRIGRDRNCFSSGLGASPARNTRYLSGAMPRYPVPSKYGISVFSIFGRFSLRWDHRRKCRNSFPFRKNQPAKFAPHVDKMGDFFRPSSIVGAYQIHQGNSDVSINGTFGIRLRMKSLMLASRSSRLSPSSLIDGEDLAFRARCIQSHRCWASRHAPGDLLIRRFLKLIPFAR